MNSNKNLPIILIVFVALALVFFAYTKMVKTPAPQANKVNQNVTVTNPSKTNDEISPNEPDVQEENAPLTQDNSLNSIEQDLNNTNIVEEDLTDLQ